MAGRRHSGRQTFKLTRLRAVVDRAVAQKSAPPAAGEIKEILSVEDYMRPHEWAHVWAVIDHLKERHRPTYARFLGEVTLAAAIVEELAEHPRVRTIDGLRRLLAARADAGGKWLVATPLANATLAREVVTLADELMLVRLDERRSDPPGASHAARAVRRGLDDRLPLYLR